jgi:hypothetical protein
MLPAVAPSAGTGTVDVTVTTAARTSPADTAKESFAYGTNLALLPTASRKQHVSEPCRIGRRRRPLRGTSRPAEPPTPASQVQHWI